MAHGGKTTNSSGWNAIFSWIKYALTGKRDETKAVSQSSVSASSLVAINARLESLEKIIASGKFGDMKAESLDAPNVMLGGVPVSPSDHTHQVKINGSTKTVPKTGGTPVDLGTYVTPTGDGTNVTTTPTSESNYTKPTSATKLSVLFGNLFYFVSRLRTSVRAVSSASDTEFPSEKAVATAIDDKVSKSNTSGLLKNDGTVDTEKKVDVANIKLDDYGGTILAKVQAMASTDGDDYARFYTTGDNVAANITDKPESGNKGFVCEVIRQRGTSSSDYRFHLICWVQASTNPYVAVVTQDTTAISWSRMNTDTTYSQISRGSGAGLAPGLPSGSGTSKYLREDGLWETPPDTTYGTFSNTVDGLVPHGGENSTEKYLTGAGTWTDNANFSSVVTENSDSGTYCLLFRYSTNKINNQAGAARINQRLYYDPHINTVYCNISGNAMQWNGLSLSFGSFSTDDNTISIV